MPLPAYLSFQGNSCPPGPQQCVTWIINMDIDAKELSPELGFERPLSQRPVPLVDTCVHQTFIDVLRTPPQNPLALRADQATHHHGWAMSQVSDKKLVNHTTEMILWSITLASMMSIFDHILCWWGTHPTNKTRFSFYSKIVLKQEHIATCLADISITLRCITSVYMRRCDGYIWTPPWWRHLLAKASIQSRGNASIFKHSAQKERVFGFKVWPKDGSQHWLQWSVADDGHPPSAKWSLIWLARTKQLASLQGPQ